MRIGVDLGGTKIEAVLLARDGSVVVRQRIATPRHNYNATLHAIAHLVAALDAQATERAMVGIGTPGAVERGSGLMKNCNSTWLNGRALLRDLTALLGERVRIANDADCLALSEAIDGAGAGARVVFGAILGTGVGGGIVVDGRLLSGPNRIAGEWGHTPLPYLEPQLPDRACYCGRANCAETFLSGPGLAETYAVLSGKRATAQTIAADYDAHALRAMQIFTMQLSRSLAQVINVLDPDVIVLGGGVSDIAAIYQSVPALWAPYVFSNDVATPLLRARHGATSGVRGAAWLWGDDYNCGTT